MDMAGETEQLRSMMGELSSSGINGNDMKNGDIIKRGICMKSLRWQKTESLLSLVSAALVILVTIWWTWYGLAFAAGMVVQAWITYGDHKYGKDEPIYGRDGQDG